MDDKARTIGYWIATGLLGSAFAASWALRPESRRRASAPKPEARVGKPALAT